MIFYNFNIPHLKFQSPVTPNIILDEEYCMNHPHKIKVGNYIQLCITDSGCGMDEDTKNKMFEPFFTTKEPGKGTGMGLASVYGTIKKSS